MRTTVIASFFWLRLCATHAAAVAVESRPATDISGVSRSIFGDSIAAEKSSAPVSASVEQLDDDWTVDVGLNPHSLVQSPSMQLVAVGLEQATVLVLSADSGRIVSRIEAEQFRGVHNWVQSMAFLDEYRLAISVGFSAYNALSVSVWDVSQESGVQLAATPPRTGHLDLVWTSLLCKRDSGALLAAVGSELREYSADLLQYEVIAQFRVGSDVYKAFGQMAQSSDGAIIAVPLERLSSMTGFHSIALVDVASASVSIVQTQHNNYINAMSFSSDSRLLVSSSVSTFVHALDTLEPMLRIRSQEFDAQFGYDVFYDTFDHCWLGPRTLATVTQNKAIRVFQIPETSNSLGSFHEKQLCKVRNAHTNWITQIVNLPNAHCLVTAANDNTVKRWTVAVQ